MAFVLHYMRVFHLSDVFPPLVHVSRLTRGLCKQGKGGSGGPYYAK